ncbi:MAG: peptidylprolyl isomerase [Myxococcota bacterium]
MLNSSLSVFFCAAILVACTNSGAKSTAAKNTQKPVVVMETNQGTFEITLFADKAPLSVKNFLTYVDEGYFSDLIFHRVIKDFMIQGGGFFKDFRKKPTRGPVKNEAANGLKNLKGTVALARTSDPDSATSQFFVNTRDNAFLDHKSPDPTDIGYCVFGEITRGMDVVEKIENVKTLCPSKSRAPCNTPLPAGMADVPETAVVILKAYRKK